MDTRGHLSQIGMYSYQSQSRTDCLAPFLYASDKLERSKGIKALTSVFAQPFTAFFLCYGFYFFCIPIRIITAGKFPECFWGMGKILFNILCQFFIELSEVNPGCYPDVGILTKIYYPVLREIYSLISGLAFFMASTSFFVFS